MAKKKAPPIDGMSPALRAKIRSAIRQVWSRSHARKLVITRCTTIDGFLVCEECCKLSPKLQVDHIIAVGDIFDGGIERMFVPSKDLQGLCKACHSIKTKIDNAKTREGKNGKTQNGRAPRKNNKRSV